MFFKLRRERAKVLSLMPDGPEAACVDAWLRGIGLTAGAARGEMLVGDELARRLGKVSGARQSFGRLDADRAALLIIDRLRDPQEKTAIQWSDGWIEDRRANAPGALLVTATRRR